MKKYIKSSIADGWTEWFREYSGASDAWSHLYVNGEEIGYVRSYDEDGAWGYCAYDTDGNFLGDYRSSDKAKAAVEKLSALPVNAADSIDDDEDDEWNPFYGGIYRVDGGPGYTTIFDNDPADAIKHWFMAQKSSPTDVAISCKTRQQAIELCKAATPEMLTRLYDKYPVPYKLDYLIDESQKQVDKGCKYFYEGDYGYGDTIHPFGVG